MQVGPSIEVLGNKAIKNGLAVSLLERLHSKYKERIKGGHKDLPLATMVTNFRCHPDILNLAGTLFYATSLKLPDDRLFWSQPYSRDSTCFVFICSSVDENVQEVKQTTNDLEATIILEELMTVTDYRNWPKDWGECDLNKVSIISQSRRQVI